MNDTSSIYTPGRSLAWRPSKTQKLLNGPESGG